MKHILHKFFEKHCPDYTNYRLEAFITDFGKKVAINIMDNYNIELALKGGEPIVYSLKELREGNEFVLKNIGKIA